MDNKFINVPEAIDNEYNELVADAVKRYKNNLEARKSEDEAFADAINDSLMYPSDQQVVVARYFYDHVDENVIGRDEAFGEFESDVRARIKGEK